MAQPGSFNVDNEEKPRRTRPSIYSFAVEGDERLKYGSQLELILTLVSYAVGLGNLWRFPYLVYENGGGTFLIPYVIALLTLGFPIFILELGLGQMLRQGTVNMWIRLGLPKLRGAGVAATFVTFMAALYYMVIVAWTVFYIGQIFMAVGTGKLPWEDSIPGYECGNATLVVNSTFANDTNLIREGGFFNPDFLEHFWCPETGIPQVGLDVPAGYSMIFRKPDRCPGQAAVRYWNEEALQKSTGITDLGGIVPGMLIAHTIVWIVLYLIVFKGVAVSGKLAYVTATLPYFCLICFFFGSVTLNNASAGLSYYVTADLARLSDVTVWQKAATQIFFSVGIGWGSIVAFGSYGDKNTDFIGHVTKVTLINCGTSIFAGVVVFSILGFLAGELSVVNPCFKSDSIPALEGIGLQGSGLAFVAFPIAISQMTPKFFWAFIFFIMLFTLGVGSGFGYVESITTVIFDSGVAQGQPRWKVAAAICTVCWALGIIFVTRAGDYWVKLFDSYTTVVATFAVCFIECIGMMWMNGGMNWTGFCEKTKRLTGREVPAILGILLKYVGPAYMVILLFLSISAWDLTGNASSGEDVFPDWIIGLGWFIGLIPVIGAILAVSFSTPPELPHMPDETLQDGQDSDLNSPLES